MFCVLNKILIGKKCSCNLIIAWEGDQEEEYWVFQGSPERKQRTKSHKMVKERKRSECKQLDIDGNQASIKPLIATAKSSIEVWCTVGSFCKALCSSLGDKTSFWGPSLEEGL